MDLGKSGLSAFKYLKKTKFRLLICMMIIVSINNDTEVKKKLIKL